jgi:signal transduction histidine kinase
VNAVQASPDSGAVEVGLHTAQNHAKPGAGSESEHPRSFACITIADHGTGMSEDTLERVFEPFFTTKDVGEGTGLGLAVAYGIVQEHGGFITVQSNPGEGSRVEVYLPLPDPQ